MEVEDDRSVFHHSVKVPTQYKKASMIFKKSIEEKKSVKSLLFEEKHAKISAILSLLTKYLRNQNLIEKCMEKAKVLKENERMNQHLCRVLVTELLLGTKKLNGESKPVQVVRSYSTKLEKYFNKYKERFSTTDKITAFDNSKPRYVRINTNLCTIKEAIEQLESEDWKQKIYEKDNYEEYIKAIREINEDEYIVDINLNEVLVFPPNTKSYLAKHDFTTTKKFMLQDKATCLVAKLLDPPIGSTILDTCAAPGMKTINLSNLIENKGCIYAIEQDKDRFKVLCSMIEQAKATCVRPVQGDAIKLKAEDYPGVEYILVDPSCSGSGMQNRLIPDQHEEKDANRLWKLAGLQIKILQHVMTEFPDCKRIVYSTCSVYEEENEQVVEKCLERCPQWKLLNGKKSLSKLWKNTGNSEYKGVGKHCIYSKPDEDLTDGIFIALFERLKNKNE